MTVKIENTRMGVGKDFVVASYVAALALASGAYAMEWSAGDLVIPANESLTVTSANLTNTSVTVHGNYTVNLGDYSRYYYILANNLSGTTTSHLAPDPGDVAVWNVGRGRIYGYYDNAPRADLTIGANGGGNGLLHLGAFQGANQQQSIGWFNNISLAENASTDADVFSPILLDSYSQLMCRTFINNNAKPLQILFTNQWNVGESQYRHFSGNVYAFYSANLFSPRKVGGDIVLRGQSNAPIVIKGWGSAGFNLFDNNADNRKANLRFEGDCDVWFQMENSSWAIFNATNVIYRHSGDTKFRFTAEKGGYVRTLVEDVLPYGPQTGNLIVDTLGGVNVTRKHLDLHGCSQKLNGLVVAGVAYLVNTNEDVTLTFGTGDTNGRLSGNITNETIFCEKVGTGTLSLESANVWSLVATNGGTLAIAEGSNHVHSLTLENVTLAYVGGALTADELHIGENARVVLDSSSQSNVVHQTFPALQNSHYIKEGNNFVTYVTPEDAQGCNLSVRGGTLRFGGEACTNAWWRFIVTKASTDKATYTSAEVPAFSCDVTLGLGVLGMFAPDGRYAYGTFSNAESGTAASGLAEGEVATARPWMRWSKDIMQACYPDVTIKTEPILAGGNASYGPTKFVTHVNFDASSRYDISQTDGTNPWLDGWAIGLIFTNGVVSAESPETITWRTKASWGRASASYALQRCVNHDNKTNFPHPTDWILESSPDGITWEKMDERTGQTFTTTSEPPYLNAQFNYTFNAHVPYLFSAKNANWKFTTFGTVEVAEGAILDLSEIPMTNIAFNALAVDCAGAGTITRFRPATNGTLHVTSSAAALTSEGKLLQTVTLPLTLGETDDMDRLASWTVVVDGKPSRASEVAYEGGHIVIHTRSGIMLLFR